MIFQDRPYQTDAVAAIWDYFRKETGNPLVAMPTGTGKSVVIARFLQSVFIPYPTQRILLLTHVKELIQQNFEKLKMLWPFAPAGIYSAGLNKREANCPITFAGIASVAKKWAMFGHIDLVLIDEAHLLSPNDQTMYRAFLAGLRSINPLLKVIGFTATPWRLGHGHLCDPFEDKKGTLCDPLFSHVCFDLTSREAFNKLIQDGYLIPLVPKRTKLHLDTEGLHSRGGEFIEKEMQDKFDKEEITHAALLEAIELGADRKHWLVFASGVDHADHIGDMLNDLGIPTGVVHSKREGRDETIEAFKRGEIRALVNNNVLTTGFDFPGIDFMVILRATSSTVLWVQILGRGMRPVYVGDWDLNTVEGRYSAIAESGKLDCLVLDFARNTALLGPANDPVIPRAKGKGGGDAPVKVCDFCDNYNHASVKYCGGFPYKTALGCGAEFSFEVKFKATAATDDLIKGDMPIVKVFSIDQITARVHQKHDKPDSIRISYYSGLKVFTDYVCIQHTDWAGRKAAKWWRERTDIPLPATTAEALELIDRVKAPTHLRVWVNKQYPQIMDYCYDGSAFGTQEPNPIAPAIETDKGRPAHNGFGVNSEDLDDEIPF